MLQSDIKQQLSSLPQAETLFKGGFERLPHALLVHGPSGVGKSLFGFWLSNLLLCDSPVQGRDPCGECTGCRLLASGNHPDYRLVEPDVDDEGEEGAKAKKRGREVIKIDQIRDLEPFVHVGSHRAGRRVVLVKHAETMNYAAANSLLKILEEPPPSIYFILISSKYRRLPATILSRCRQVAFSALASTDADPVRRQLGLDSKDDRYLQLSGGTPFKVADWKQRGLFQAYDALIESLGAPARDPLVLAARWESLLKANPELSLEDLVEGVQRWTFDLALERLAGAVRYHAGWPRPKPGDATLDTHALLSAWRNLNQFRRSARHPLNQLLFLESMATEFLRGLRAERR